MKRKAEEAYSHIGSPVLVEDASLVINGMGKLPGPLVKWFLEELGNDGLCRLADSYSDRSAVAACLFGLYDGTTLLVFEGKITGQIAKAPRGERGFGWDTIFIPDGETKTWGEMNEEEQQATSMRRQALLKLAACL